MQSGRFVFLENSTNITYFITKQQSDGFSLVHSMHQSEGEKTASYATPSFSKAPYFILSFVSSNSLSKSIERKWMPEEVHELARAIQFYEDEESEKNAEIFKHSLEV